MCDPWALASWHGARGAWSPADSLLDWQPRHVRRPESTELRELLAQLLAEGRLGSRRLPEVGMCFLMFVFRPDVWPSPARRRDLAQSQACL